MPARHLEVGRLGEDAAAAHLEAKGYAVLERNLALGRLELDLVCRDGDTLVFVEVKTRAEGSLAAPSDAMTGQKRARLVRAAQTYLSRRELWHRPCRFDVVSVLLRGGKAQRIDHVENAFGAEASGSWQPW